MFCSISIGDAIPENCHTESLISPPPNTLVLTNGAEPFCVCVVGDEDRIDNLLMSPSANDSSPPNLSGSANKILNQLKIPNNERTFNFSCGKYRLSKNITIEKPYPVFPRYFEI